MENLVNEHEEEVINPEQFQVGRASTEEKHLEEDEEQEGEFLDPNEVETDDDDDYETEGVEDETPDREDVVEDLDDQDVTYNDGQSGSKDENY